MKNYLMIMMALLSLTTLGQQMTYKEWEEQSKTNIGLLPKYGHIQKTDEQIASDNKFIRETMMLEQFKGDRTVASNHLIDLGFNYLYRGDLKTAMYRYNQAYLLDTSNTDVYWGYGAVYMAVGDYEKAKLQYKEGLSKKPDNTHLLTDFGTYFMARYYDLQPVSEENALINIDSAFSYLLKSYELDDKDQNTAYKLSICYWLNNDCDNAWKYYDKCEKLGGQPITEEFTKDLKKKCKRKK